MTSRTSSRAAIGLVRISLVALLVAAAALTIVSGAGAQTASARFTYELCDSALPGGAPPSAELHTERAYAEFQNCAAPGGSIGVTQTGQVTEGPGWVEIGVPETPGGYVESGTLTASLSNLQPSATGHAVVGEGWPPDNGGDQPRFFLVNPTEPTCLFLCANGWGFDVTLTCSATCEPGASIGVHYIAATEVDPRPPVVSKVEGPLLAGGVLRGHQALTAMASDKGGGLSVIDALVNGTVAPGAVPGSCAVAEVNNPSYQGLAAYSATPCPAALPGSWDLNTAEFPFHEGANTVEVCASDFATVGPPNTTCSPARTVEVNNSCTESPVVGGQNLSAGIQGVTGEAVTVPFEHSAIVEGDLTSNAGEPISGATICVQSQVQEPGTEPATVATATTDANGGFSYEVPPGPNRRLLLGYRHDAFQVGKTLEVNSHAKPTIELDRGRIRRGGRIKITGSLPGVDPAGRVVVLQASSLHGNRWLTFRRATTGPKGGFHSAYRFGDAPSTITYRMRAAVPRQAGYPYEPGHSTPARIKVLGPGAGNKKSHKEHTHGGREHERSSRRAGRPADDHRDRRTGGRNRGAGRRCRWDRRRGPRKDRGAQGRSAQGHGPQGRDRPRCGDE